MIELIHFKRFFIVLFFIALFSSCSSSDISKDYKESPCNDPQYIILKQMKPSELTSGQSEYLAVKEKECTKFKADYERNSDKKQAKTNLIWILSGLGVILVAGILIGLAFKNGSWH